MYDRIIVGYDGSEPSKAALKEAALWTRKHGGALSLVNVVYFDQEEFAIPPSLMEKRVEAAARMCREAEAGLAAEYGPGVKLETLVREGEPPEVIARIAEDKRADLIALGTYGRTGLKRLLVGSVTSETILEAPCDVLVVKRPCSSCTGTYSSILVPFDGSEHGKKALRRAAELARMEGGKVTVLYVIPRYEEMVEFFRTDAIERSLHSGAEKVIEEAKKVASALKLDIGTEIREGHAADEIVKVARTLENDLIAMGTHGWKGVSKVIMGSTTNRVITHASSPVLVVH